MIAPSLREGIPVFYNEPGIKLTVFGEPGSGTHAMERHVEYHWFQNLMARMGRPVEHAVPLIMYVDKIRNGGEIGANHHHDFFSLYFVRQGRGVHIIDGTGYGVARGDVYLMAPDMTHHFEDCQDLSTDTLHFSPELFDPATLDALSEMRGFQLLTAGIQGGRWLHLTPPDYEQVTEMLAELTTEFQSGTASGAVMTRALFLRLLVYLSRRWSDYEKTVVKSPQSPAPAHEGTIAAAVRYMDAHFAEPLRVEQIAASVFLSPDRFTEVFAKAMGRTPRDYLRYLRVESAKALLVSTNASMTDVAQRAGFGDPSYFTRAFRAATGLTPRAFRQRNAKRVS